MWGIKMKAHLRKLFKHKPRKFWKVSGRKYYLKRYIKGRQKTEMSGRMSELCCGLFRKLKRNMKILVDINLRP